MGKDEMTAGECRMRIEVQVHTDGNERYNYKSRSMLLMKTQSNTSLGNTWKSLVIHEGIQIRL